MGKSQILFASLILCAVPMLGQEGPGRFGAVKGWKGRITMEHHWEDSRSSEAYRETWNLTRSATVEIRLDQYDPEMGPGAWHGTIKGPAKVDYTYTLTSGKDTYVETWKGAKDVEKQANDGAPRQFYLTFENDHQFTIWPGDPYINVHTKGGDIWEVDRVEHVFPPAMDYFLLDAPAQGYHLQGSVVMSLPEFVSSLAAGPFVRDAAWNVTYDIEPIDTEDIEVKVEIPGHDAWRPEAGTLGARGNFIDLIAKLQKVGGGEPQQKAVGFEWEFADVSHEPGYAMNKPTDEADKKADLRFEPSDELLVLGDESTSARSTSGTRTQSTVRVASYDWGGWGTVRVAAILEDGRRIEGKLDGDPDILLPKRPKGRLIAQSWLTAHGAMGKADAAEDENDPVGDGNRGDGYTLYEEYRGFIEDGDHIEGNPDKKDYFIHNHAGGLYTPGILLFAKQTGLEVHYKLWPSEMPVSRVMNLNRQRGPHVADQHGVYIEAGPVEMTYAIAEGGPGTPGMIERVLTPRLIGSLVSPQKLQYMYGTLAHELLHASNVYHHGDGVDKQVHWRRKPGAPDGVFLEAGEDGEEHEIRVLRENGSAFDAILPETGIGLTLGGKQGEHSGHDDCVMRYDISGGYAADSDPNLRYRVREKSGWLVCSESAGTGVNDPVREPQSRYSGAGPGRGDCKHQILVNDAVKASKR